jgi:hypothetical protein
MTVEIARRILVDLGEVLSGRCEERHGFRRKLNVGESDAIFGEA